MGFLRRLFKRRSVPLPPVGLIHHRCNYCGGWDERISDDPGESSCSAMRFTLSLPGQPVQSREICFRCLFESWDHVMAQLGKPYKDPQLEKERLLAILEQANDMVLAAQEKDGQGNDLWQKQMEGDWNGPSREHGAREAQSDGPPSPMV